jgi:hypothetical protein
MAQVYVLNVDPATSTLRQPVRPYHVDPAPARQTLPRRPCASPSGGLHLHEPKAHVFIGYNEQVEGWKLDTGVTSHMTGRAEAAFSELERAAPQTRQQSPLPGPHEAGFDLCCRVPQPLHATNPQQSKWQR